MSLGAWGYGCADFVLKGYFNGKRAAEARMAQLFPSGGVALRPGFISGTRQVAGVGVPLQVVGAPLPFSPARPPAHPRLLFCR